MPFDGETYDRPLDQKRLGRQLDSVRSWMVSRAGRWFTLAEICQALAAIHQKPFPEASVSARLRDLRKSAFGGFCLDRRRLEKGLWEYSLNLKGTQVEMRL